MPASIEDGCPSIVVERAYTIQPSALGQRTGWRHRSTQPYDGLRAWQWAVSMRLREVGRLPKSLQWIVEKHGDVERSAPEWCIPSATLLPSQAASASGTASLPAAACHRYTVTSHIQIFYVKLAWIEPIFCRFRRPGLIHESSTDRLGRMCAQPACGVIRMPGLRARARPCRRRRPLP